MFKKVIYNLFQNYFIKNLKHDFYNDTICNLEWALNFNLMKRIHIPGQD